MSSLRAAVACFACLCASGTPASAASRGADDDADPVFEQLLSEAAGARPVGRAGLKTALVALRLARAQAELLAGQAELLRQLESLTRLRYARGEGTQQDLLRAQAEALRLLPRTEAQQAEALQRLYALNACAGRPLATPLAEAGDLVRQPVGAADGVWSARARARTDVPEAEVELQVALRLVRLRAIERGLEIYASGVLPQAELTAQSAVRAYEAGQVPLAAVLGALLLQFDDRSARLRLLAEHATLRAQLAEASLESAACAPGMAPGGAR